MPGKPPAARQRGQRARGCVQAAAHTPQGNPGAARPPQQELGTEPSLPPLIGLMCRTGTKTKTGRAQIVPRGGRTAPSGLEPAKLVVIRGFPAPWGCRTMQARICIRGSPHRKHQTLHCMTAHRNSETAPTRCQGWPAVVPTHTGTAQCILDELGSHREYARSLQVRRGTREVHRAGCSRGWGAEAYRLYREETAQRRAA